MKKQLRLTGTLLLFLFSCMSLHAQWDDGLWVGKQANNWIFFDDVGLNFDTTPPTFFNCQTSSNTEEGVGTISNQNGDLLFSISADTLWNKNHQPMVNGTGLMNDFTAVQTGLTVPVPNTNNLYYVFQIKHKHSGSDKGATLSYSIVDMDLQGGLGEVVSKNIPLAFPVGDKLTAVHHADGNQVWIISHEGNYGGFSNNFLAFLVSENGVAPPVVSSVGATLTYSDAGQMKASPDGSKIAYADGLGFFGIPPNLWAFDFDNATGQVSNPVDLTSAIVPSVVVYGLEFSPNSRFLYMTNPGIPNFLPAKLHQFDLQAGNQSDVLASHAVVAEITDDPSFWSLQLASDGKIYMANSNLSAIQVGSPPAFPGTVGVIHYPNNAGLAADFKNQAIALQGQNCGPGLPGFIQSYFESGILHEGNCAGNAVAFSTLRIPGIESTVWDFGDPDSGADNTATTTNGNSNHIFSSPGTYTITATITSNGAQQTATTEVTIVEGATANQPDSIVACDDGTSNASFDLSQQDIVILGNQDPNTHTVSYHTTQADAQNNANPITNLSQHVSPGQTIYVRVTNTAGCYGVTQFDLLVMPIPQIPGNLELTGCSPIDLTQVAGEAGADLSLSYYVSQADAEAETDAIADPGEYDLAENEQTIYLRGETPAGCADIATLLLIREECAIPQGISPNGDAFNQSFDLSHLNIQSLEIFNRYGRSVFNKESYTNEWFGQTDGGDELPTGTYFYVIQLENGEIFQGKQTLTGWVYINREVN